MRERSLLGKQKADGRPAKSSTRPKGTMSTAEEGADDGADKTPGTEPRGIIPLVS